MQAQAISPLTGKMFSHASGMALEMAMLIVQTFMFPRELSPELNDPLSYSLFPSFALVSYMVTL